MRILPEKKSNQLKCIRCVFGVRLLLLFFSRPDKGSTQIQLTQTAKIQNINTNLKSNNTVLK